VLNEALLTFSQWLSSQEFSQSLISSLYLWNWLEATHVLTLMVSLGMLFMIDLRMLGWSMTKIPASTIAARLNTPMLIGFIIMIITGSLLYYANALHETQSIWFRVKMVLLVFAAINAWLFHRAMSRSIDTWDTDPIPPRRIRIGAGLSLVLWMLVVFTGRAMAYNWFDCDIEQGAFINWAVGCSIGK